MHVFARPMQVTAFFVRREDKVFPTNLFQSTSFFFALFRNARARTTWLMSRRVASRVCRRVTHGGIPSRWLARLWASAITWSLVNFYGENLTSRRTRGPDSPSGFPFLFDARARAREHCTLSSRVRRTKTVYQCEPRRKPDIDRILREVRAAAHRPGRAIRAVWRKRPTNTWMDDINRPAILCHRCYLLCVRK